MADTDLVQDVLFTVLETGDYDGLDMPFSLVRQSDGTPAWSVEPVNYPAPSLKRHMIKLTVVVGEGIVNAAGAADFTPLVDALDNLDVLAVQTDDMKLEGWDGRIYYVRIVPTSMRQVVIGGQHGSPKYIGVEMELWSVWRTSNV